MIKELLGGSFLREGKMMEKTENRNYGIDLLRIVSMIMVVILHVLGQGGILNSCQINSPLFYIAWFMETAAFCAVNCYAMISGYVGVKSKHKFTNIIPLYLEVIFYTVIIALLFFFIPKTANINHIWQAFFPFAYSHYWYFTAYFALFFFMPYINKMLLILEKKEIKTLILIIVLLFSFSSYIFQRDSFKLSWGYSTMWITLLYILGGCYRLLTEGKSVNKLISISCYALGIIVAYLTKVLTVLKTDMVTYTSPAILLASSGLFLFFANINIKNNVFKKIIMFFAPLSFGVYLIHTEPLVWTQVMSKAFVSYINLSPAMLVVAVILTALSIWLVCSLVDFLRFYLFKLLKIKNLSDKIYKKFTTSKKPT